MKIYQYLIVNIKRSGLITKSFLGLENNVKHPKLHRAR